ncbi:MAG: ribonuclease III [Patescibacteria group bacterium]
MPDTKEFSERINVLFKNPDLLLQAFVHRSYLNENPKFRLSHNERLEFLGDAVLELTVTEALYEKYPEKPEGELTSFRAALVNAKMLSVVAEALGMNEFLLMSKGESKDTGRARQFLLANALEAVIGAVYLDRGYETAHKFVMENVLVRLSDVIENKLFRDPKSLFQEFAQEKVSITPSYQVIKEWGPDHDRNFVVGLYLKDELVAEGEGHSKQTAEVNAAEKGLVAKNWN